jgi:hypothetical protein
VNNKAEDLALLDIVEANNPNETIRVFRTTSLDFVQHFLNTFSAKQRQLP